MSVCARCRRPACDLSRRACVSPDCGLRDQVAGNRQPQVLRREVERVPVHAEVIAR
jgi:hypothetical protein